MRGVRLGGGGGVSKLLVPFSHLTHSQFLPIRAREKYFDYPLNFHFSLLFHLTLKDCSLLITQTILYLFNVR